MSRRVIVLSIMSLVLIAFGVGAYLDYQPKAREQSASNSFLNQLPQQSATIADTSLTLYVPATTTDLARGLGGVEHLPSGHGMLFYIPNQQQLSFWMKDMHIAIDILWLDQQRQVIHIETDITPDTYPESFSNPDDTNADYVLELASGEVQRLGIDLGDTLELRSPLTSRLPTI